MYTESDASATLSVPKVVQYVVRDEQDKSMPCVPDFPSVRLSCPLTPGIIIFCAFTLVAQTGWHETKGGSQDGFR